MRRDSGIDIQQNNNPDISAYTENRYNVFIVIWAIAALFHMARSNVFFDSLDYCLFSISIAILIVKPSSIPRLLLFISLQLITTFRIMPTVANHEIFYALANLTILQALVYVSIKNQTFNIDKKSLFDTFAPAIRIELMILYFYVVFHKLNTDFFNPGFSCATDFYKEQNSHNLLPSSNALFLANAYFTICIEALIPLLLCFKKTRNAGLIIGLIFHFIIAYNPINRFFDISAAIFAAYVLFMNYSFSDIITDVYNKINIYLKKLLQQTYSPGRLLLISIMFTAVLLIVFLSTKYVSDYFRYFLWTIFSTIFICCAILSVSKKSSGIKDITKVHFRVPSTAFLFIPFIIFINGLCPYLGLKTNYSFSMFSNLRTEGNISNHFFMPVSLQIFDYQKDIIEIISSTNPHLQKIADRKELIVFFSFNRLVHYLHPKRVEYLRNGKHFIYDINSHVPEDPDLIKDNPYILHKLLVFRTIKKYDPQPCSH